jgi:hypothetical protein
MHAERKALQIHNLYTHTVVIKGTKNISTTYAVVTATGWSAPSVEVQSNLFLDYPVIIQY